MANVRRFESIEVNQTVTFENEGKIETGVVCKVSQNTFTLRVMQCWDNNGTTSFYDAFYNFYKTGTKSHLNYTYGNAIEINGSI